MVSLTYQERKVLKADKRIKSVKQRGGIITIETNNIEMTREMLNDKPTKKADLGCVTLKIDLNSKYYPGVYKPFRVYNPKPKLMGGIEVHHPMYSPPFGFNNKDQIVTAGCWGSYQRPLVLAFREKDIISLVMTILASMQHVRLHYADAWDWH